MRGDGGNAVGSGGAAGIAEGMFGSRDSTITSYSLAGDVGLVDAVPARVQRGERWCHGVGVEAVARRSDSTRPRTGAPVRGPGDRRLARRAIRTDEFRRRRARRDRAAAPGAPPSGASAGAGAPSGRAAQLRRPHRPPRAQRGQTHNWDPKTNPFVSPLALRVPRVPRAWPKGTRDTVRAPFCVRVVDVGALKRGPTRAMAAHSDNSCEIIW